MLITQKIAPISELSINGRAIDALQLQWFETGKRILHKTTQNGTALTLRFLKENQNLQQGDVLFENESTIIAVEILPCEVIVLKPASMYDMAFICYEIGNKHLPLFYQEEVLLIPYEAPIFRMLQATGFNPAKENRKLLHQLRTSVASHGHGSDQSGESLFSKILKLTSKNAE